MTEKDEAEAYKRGQRDTRLDAIEKSHEDLKKELKDFRVFIRTSAVAGAGVLLAQWAKLMGFFGGPP